MNKYFDRIYALYITKSELARIKYKLTKRNIQAEYFLGVDGRKQLLTKFQDYIAIRSKLKRYYIKAIGGFGHVHSIINIIQDAINKNYSKILILEPDIYFAKDFDSLIDKYLKLTYKLLYLGASQHNWTNINKNVTSLANTGFYHADNTCGTFALALDRSIFEEYLDILNRLDYPSDVCLCELQKKYREDSLVVFPSLIICDVTKSTTSDWKRSQRDLEIKFKWTREYIYEDEFIFDLKLGIFYKLIVVVTGTKKGNLTLAINNKAYRFVLPDELIIERKKYSGKVHETHIIYVYAESNSLSVFVNGIVLEDIQIIDYSAFTRTHIRNFLSKYLNTKNSLLVSYYTRQLTFL